MQPRIPKGIQALPISSKYEDLLMEYLIWCVIIVSAVLISRPIVRVLGV